MSLGPAGTVAPLVDLGLESAGVPLSDRDFEQLRRLLHDRAGIALGPQKRLRMTARLSRRLRALGLGSFADYHRYLSDPAHGEEMVAFVNALTTNKTDFYREPHHFEHLQRTWAPAVRDRVRAGEPCRLRLWSSACSTGEEVYTLAITLHEARLVPPAWDVRILASDIDTDVLARAAEGVYAADRVAPVPAALLPRYFLRRRDGGGEVRVRRELRDLVTFRQLNLAAFPWPVRAVFDVIFCRNVLIYFDRDLQRRILEEFRAALRPGGLLFLGHSESVFGLVSDLRHLGNTICARPVAEGERPA